MSDVVYPVHGWESDLSCLPPLRETAISSFVSTKTTKGRRKAYKLVTESYVVASTVSANYSCKTANTIFVKASCYRSQRKTLSPYTVKAALSLQGDILGGLCECAAGKHACNHLQAVLKLVALLQVKGYNEAPEHLSSTDLPQQWRVPRTNPLRGTSLQQVDWRRVGEGGQDLPRTSRLYKGIAANEDPKQQEEDIKAFADALKEINGMQEFASFLDAADSSDVTETKFGTRLKGCLLDYQQSVVPHGFAVFISKELEVPRPQIWASAELFTGAFTVPQWKIPDTFDGASAAFLKSICITPAEAQDLERTSRRQRNSLTWHQGRLHRLTASNFGLVLNRKKWTKKGLINLTTPKDLSRVQPVRYGIANEKDALLRYKDTLTTAGHPVDVFNCGLFVDPSRPWLGASPDALTFDPCEPFPWGTVEVKCPYSHRHATREVLLSEDFFVAFDEDCQPELKVSHEHYK
ncbi:uncharacterized protein [Dermacentor albipictus]|uniref:uncharacterized protein n=1 Tax=Dermacentor albipictus TaxID=60249 RepID=UPI0038FD143F